MPNDRLSDHERIIVLAVAQLNSEGSSHDTIAKTLGLPNTTAVSRLLETARQHSWVQRGVNWPSSEDKSAVSDLLFNDRATLLKHLTRVAHKNDGVEPETLRIINTDFAPTKPSDSPDATLATRLAYFGQLAATDIIPLIHKARHCAVAWGYTVSAVVNGCPQQPVARGDLSFVPISGDPFNSPARGLSPSTAANELARRFRTRRPSPSLLGVATRIPKKMASHGDTIREFFRSSTAYNHIFGDTDPLMDRIDMIITGVGSVSSSKDDPWFAETIQMEEMDTDGRDLAALSVGNIGGVWLPNTDRDVAAVEDINGRWLGIQKEHYVKCARRRDSKDAENAQGVVVVAIGKSKAPIVKRALGMVNHLIIDRELAAALMKDFDGSTKNERT